METRAPHPRLLILPVAFALTCVILSIIAYVVFGGSTPLAPVGYRVTIPLPQATNLVPGSDVEIAGVTVGHIVALNRAGNGAKATVQLATEFVPLRDGATAIERTKTLLGEGYIELAPGPRSARAIPDRGMLPARQVRNSVALDQFVSTFGPSARSRLRQLFAGLATAFGGREEPLNSTLGWAAPLSANVDTVLSTIQAQRSDLQRLVATSGTVLAAVGRRSGPLQAAITASDQVLQTTAQRNRGLAATITALVPLLGQLTRTSNDITAASPELTAAVGALEPTAPLIPPALRAVDTAAPQFRALFTQLPATLTAGRRALPQLTAMVGAARTAFRQFYPTSRDLIPFMQLFASNDDIVDILANVGSVSGGTYVGPNGTVVNYAAGLPTIWNEAVAGLAHKLPTNRQNPYPEPGALLDEGKLGVLKSYDCRNLGNPLVIPATGTGAPSCILQGPWTFDGKSAYYPRLQLAPP
jgi:phospholipid/cholesterol/gamma-HCH transport system substrate-binding protein